MNNLKKLRTESNLTVRDLAEKLNISYSTISKLENGDTHFNNDYIRVLTNFFNVSADYLLGLPSNSIPLNDGIFKAVKILGSVNAGTVSEMVDQYMGMLQAKVDNPDNYFYLQVSGDSMSPTFEDGDYVLVKFQRDANDGQVVVAGMNGSEATVKRYKKIGEEQFLFADNTKYTPIKLTEDLNPYIVGVVEGYFRPKIK